MERVSVCGNEEFIGGYSLSMDLEIRWMCCGILILLFQFSGFIFIFLISYFTFIPFKSMSIYHIFSMSIFN